MTSGRKEGVKKPKKTLKKPSKKFKFKLKKEKNLNKSRENPLKVAGMSDASALKADVSLPKTMPKTVQNKPKTKVLDSLLPKEKDEKTKQKVDPASISRTVRFQDELKSSFEELLADKLVTKKLSRDVAYKIFKEAFDTMVEFTRLDKEYKLPLAGVGTFSINMSPPRKPVRGGESKLAAFAEIPHLKWKPSDRYRKYLFKKVLGYEEE